MYVAVYLHPVPTEHLQQFLHLMRASGEVYLENGALDVQILLATDITETYGFKGLEGVVETHDGEVVVLFLHRFADRARHARVMRSVDSESWIHDLSGQMGQIVDLGRAIRGEFEVVG